MKNVLDLKMQGISEDILKYVPARVALHYSVMPVGFENGLLKLAVPEDFSRQSREEIRIVLGLQIDFVTLPKEKIDEVIGANYGVGAGTIESLTREREGTSDFSAEGGSAFGGEVIDKDQKESATIIKLVNELLMDALKYRASDIHIEPFDKSFRIRYRVDGLLQEARVSENIRSLAASLISRIKIMANLDIGEKRLPQDGRIKIKQREEELDLRVSVLPSSAGEAIVIRILKSLQLLDLHDLGFETDALGMLRKQLRKPHGMILVTGPTGSGKTTTLYACLKELNSIDRKIITIEDPVEYKLPGVVQIQVNSKIDLTFARALRSILRHDPDSIMVGEIRDPETAEIAIRSALTGHLVLSTLHTNDASSAVTRLLEMGIEPYLVSSSLHAVIAQRLIRKSCKPCEKCQHFGFYGRTVIYELMCLNETLRKMTTERQTASVIREQAIKDGMITFIEDGQKKIDQGITTADEIQRVIVSDK